MANTFFIDKDGFHIHDKPDPNVTEHIFVAVGMRKEWRAVCSCGKVVASGSERKARSKLAIHILSHGKA